MRAEECSSISSELASRLSELIASAQSIVVPHEQGKQPCSRCADALRLYAPMIGTETAALLKDGTDEI